jgi:hypothetical protein
MREMEKPAAPRESSLARMMRSGILADLVVFFGCPLVAYILIRRAGVARSESIGKAILTMVMGIPPI